MTTQLLHGDCLDILKTLPDKSVQVCVTSPPYYGLRSYTDDPREIGKEPTPAAYVAALVAVFAEVWRVLRDDGTLWVNMGDSMTSSTSGMKVVGSSSQRKGRSNDGHQAMLGRVEGLKPKNLLGMPWMVARAMQEPRYTGRITKEIDRVWLAAIIDAEGTICGFTHDRKDDGRTRTGVHIQITNSSTALLDKANTIWTASRSEHGHPGDGHLGLVDSWRWTAHGASNKAQLMRELYPYFVVKQKQALIAYNICMLIADARRLMHTPQAQQVRDKRTWAMDALSRLNHGEHVDIPSWCVEPPSPHAPGWILRSDIIWAKTNPMPESVQDRPTRSHEYMFLFAKQTRYYYDASAIAEPISASTIGRWGDRATERMNAHSSAPDRNDYKPASGEQSLGARLDGTRNKRSVWTIPTQPVSLAPDCAACDGSGVDWRAFQDSFGVQRTADEHKAWCKANPCAACNGSGKGDGDHFAIMPEALIEPCILAGSAARACETCGAAWGRVVERTEGDNTEWKQSAGATGKHAGRIDQGLSSTKSGFNKGSKADYYANAPQSVTTGFAPRCACAVNTGAARSVVLDPFGGSGTVAKVAERFQRNAILIDLNAEYIELQEQRTDGVQIELFV